MEISIQIRFDFIRIKLRISEQSTHMHITWRMKSNMGYYVVGSSDHTHVVAIVHVLKLTIVHVSADCEFGKISR